MKIIIVGAGKVGTLLCKDLAGDDHDVILIEKDEDKLNQVLNSYDINALLGNGAATEIQQEARIEECDLFISVTGNDELNMIACVIAKKNGAKHTIARVRNPEYSTLNSKLTDAALFINPEKEAAQKCVQLLEFPLASSFQWFTNNKAPVVEIAVTNHFKFVGKSLIEFRSMYKNIIVCAIKTKDNVVIPKGDSIIEENSHLFVTGPLEELENLYKDSGLRNTKIKSIIIIGGSLIAQYVIETYQKSRIHIKLIENDYKKAKALSEKFPNVEVIHCDGSSQDDLKEQGIENYDALLSLTGIDEENIVISLLAESLGIKKTLTKINRKELIDLIGLKSIITPKRIIANKILQYARALKNSEGSTVEVVYRIADDQIEALQFKVLANSKLTQTCIRDLRLHQNVLIAYIVRSGKVIFPTGNDKIYEGDRIVLFSKNIHLKELDEIIL